MFQITGIMHKESNSAGPRFYRVHTPVFHHSIRRWYSPSDSYLQITEPEGRIGCNDTLRVDISYTSQPETNFRFYYKVCRSVLVYNIHFTVIQNI